jgi:hypothetical protein
MGLNNLIFSGLDNKTQNMVQRTVDYLDKNPFLARMFDFMNEQGTPIQLGGSGLNDGQAAGTFFNNDASVDRIILGSSSFSDPVRFAGDLFNEIYSGVAVPGASGGDVGSFITQQQEFASFFGDGFAQEIAKGNNDPDAKEALANLDAFYGRATGDVIKDPDGYGSLPKGSAFSSALAWMGEKGFLPKSFVEEAQRMIDDILGGGGSNGQAAKDAEKKVQQSRQNTPPNTPKLDQNKQQTLLNAIEQKAKKAATDIKEKTGKDAKDIEKEQAEKTTEKKAEATPTKPDPATNPSPTSTNAASKPVMATDKKEPPKAGDTKTASASAPPEKPKTKAS